MHTLTRSLTRTQMLRNVSDSTDQMVSHTWASCRLSSRNWEASPCLLSPAHLTGNILEKQRIVVREAWAGLHAKMSPPRSSSHLVSLAEPLPAPAAWADERWSGSSGIYFIRPHDAILSSRRSTTLPKYEVHTDMISLETLALSAVHSPVPYEEHLGEISGHVLTAQCIPTMPITRDSILINSQNHTVFLRARLSHST